MKTKAILIHANGGPEVLQWQDYELGEPGPGEVLIRHTAIGFNFVETYIRRGLYLAPPLPHGMGIEAAGVIEAIGPGVRGFRKGSRVAYAGPSRPGADSEACIRSTAGLVKLPAWLDDKTAAAALSKGRTVEYLFNRTHKLKKGDTILFYAAAGGVGLIACQWAKAIGATIIGTVSTEAKARLATRYGCTHTIVTASQDIVAEVKRLTNGKGVDVVYDSVGKDSFEDSLEAVRPLGLVVNFGIASGEPRPFDLGTDGLKKSIFITRATSRNYQLDPAVVQAGTRKLFNMIRNGQLKIPIGQTYALKDAAQAHRDAEARLTTGATILIP